MGLFSYFPTEGVVSVTIARSSALCRGLRSRRVVSMALRVAMLVLVTVTVVLVDRHQRDVDAHQDAEHHRLYQAGEHAEEVHRSGGPEYPPQHDQDDDHHVFPKDVAEQPDREREQA